MRRRETLFIQFAKVPAAGSVKRRMQPLLTPEQACELHRDLMCWTCETLVSAGLADVELWLAEAGGGPAPEAASGPATDASVARDRAVTRCIELGVTGLRNQCGDDLGQRMLHAMGDGLHRYRRVVLVGSDCPGIDRSYLAGALAALEEVELVIGPASDGGYVLLGGRCIDPALFTDIAWGSDTVFATTAARADRLSLDWRALPVLVDIDRPEDLPVWEGVRRARAGREA